MTQEVRLTVAWTGSMLILLGLIAGFVVGALAVRRLPAEYMADPAGFGLSIACGGVAVIVCAVLGWMAATNAMLRWAERSS